VTIRACTILTFATLVACAPPPRPTFGNRIRVESDPDVPVAHAEVLRDGIVLARTDDAGYATVTLAGSEGELVELRIRCPAELEQPRPLEVRLRRSVDGRHADHGVSCPPRQRKVVIAVRAPGFKNAPVTATGETVAHSDALGVAHALVSAKPGDTIDVTLDTSSLLDELRRARQGRRRRLRPEIRRREAAAAAARPEASDARAPRRKNVNAVASSATTHRSTVENAISCARAARSERSRDRRRCRHRVVDRSVPRA
jgi:hypothetical protein